MGLRLLSLAGLLVFVAIAWALSENRSKIDWRLVAWGLGLQIVFGVLVLKTALRDLLFRWVEAVFDTLTDSAMAGSRFVFGNLGEFFIIRQDALVGAEDDLVMSAVVGFQVLPVIIFVSSLAAVLFHLRVIQIIVSGMAWLMRRTLKTSGAETFAAALLVFFGIESLTAVREYLKSMTRSELCTIATAFMGTIAASVMVAYAQFGVAPGHLLAASLMSAPAAIVLSKILVPETGEPPTRGRASVRVEIESRNVLDAAARGATQGLHLAFGIAGMLIAFVAMVHLLDVLCSGIFGVGFVTLLGYAFTPVAVLLGVPWQDLAPLSQLLGAKTVLTELIAYQNLQGMAASGTISPRTTTIATYALCGFTHPASLAILLAGFTGLVPERRDEIVALGVKAFIGGLLACMMTACIAGVLVYE